MVDVIHKQTQKINKPGALVNFKQMKITIFLAIMFIALGAYSQNFLDVYKKTVKESNTITTSGTDKVLNNNNVTFEASNEVLLNGGFEVQQGDTFEVNMNGFGEH